MISFEKLLGLFVVEVVEERKKTTGERRNKQCKHHLHHKRRRRRTIPLLSLNLKSIHGQIFWHSDLFTVISGEYLLLSRFQHLPSVHIPLRALEDIYSMCGTMHVIARKDRGAASMNL